ncbi:MAG: GntR family transcriptional regulator [Acetobacteraceae bacterium]
MEAADLQISRETVTLRLRVEEKLRGAIVSGHFKPGTRLIERELCEQIGVGRTSVREALRQLEAEGLVTTVPHRGPTVSRISVEEAEQLYAVRGLLEGYAGRRFAERDHALLKDELKAFSLAMTALEKATRGSDHKALIYAKTAFYAALMEGGGNIIVKQTLTTLHNRITLLRLTSMTQPGRLKQSMKEVRTIYDAIVNRDGPQAEAACINHVNAAATVAIAVLSAANASG